MNHWFDERFAEDAPIRYEAEEANAWAAGWNAAVEACAEEQNEILRRETEGGRRRKN